MLSRPWDHQKLDYQRLFSIQITVIEFPPSATIVKCPEIRIVELVVYIDFEQFLVIRIE